MRLGPALETLDGLIAQGHGASFDFAFIDADKANYVGYYEHCLTLVRKGGVIGLDNTLWSGAVADPSDHSEDTVAIRALNQLVFGDKRVSACVLPIGDGFSLALKR